MAILETKNLSFSRGSLRVLDQISFGIEPQSILGLAGPNGGGKSSLLEVLMGWHSRTDGEVCRAADLKMALLPQTSERPKALPISVKDFVSMGTWSKEKRAKPALSIDEALKELGLEDFVHKSLSELSGGEWKRVCLAQCLVQPADLYLLDEPFNYLDMKSEDRVGHLLQKLARDQKKTFFVISHDWHAMNHFFDRVILLNRKVLAQGSVKEVAQLYLNWADPKSHEWLHKL